ncbi:Transposase (probable), IS891/IS1136/IS1341 domain protein, partial [mine drainage metagenome]
AQSFEYTKNVRKDVIHKATHAIVRDPARSLFVVEDLKIQNMTKAPKPKKATQDGPSKTEQEPSPVSTERSCHPAGACSSSSCPIRPNG